MIFVTVGTTHFDPLIQAVDALAIEGRLADSVLFQIGSGRYEPRGGEFFRFKPSIDHELASADLVITHGGITVLSLLASRKRFVAVANTALADNHQSRYLELLGNRSSMIWTDCVDNLSVLVDRALAAEPARIETPSLVPNLLAYMGVADTSQGEERPR